MKKDLLMYALIGILATGCASIVSDSKYPVSIQSHPAEAQFIVINRNGVEVQSGTTPDTVTLESGSGYFKRGIYTVVIKKNGFEDSTLTLRSSMDGWYWGNIGFGGIIGLLFVDPISGAMWKLPNTLSTSLDQKIATPNTNNGPFHEIKNILSYVPHHDFAEVTDDD